MVQNWGWLVQVIVEEGSCLGEEVTFHNGGMEKKTQAAHDYFGFGASGFCAAVLV